MLTCRGHDLWFANIWSRCNLENHCYYDRSSEHFKNYDLQFYKAHICITSSLLWIVKIIVNGAPEHSRGLWTVCRKNSKNLSLRYLVPDSCLFEFLFKLLTWLFVKGKFINFSCVFFQHTFPFQFNVQKLFVRHSQVDLYVECCSVVLFKHCSVCLSQWDLYTVITDESYLLAFTFIRM